MSNTKQLSFQHVLIVSPASKRSKGLAGVLQKYLPQAKFSFLSHAHLLLDQQPEGGNVDLMIIELTENRSAIYKWYSKNDRGHALPPAIFLGHPATISDAGHFYRAGASDYLSLSGLKRSQLLRSLAVTSTLMEKRKAIPADESVGDHDVSIKPFSLKTIIKDEKTSARVTVDSEDAKDKRSNADFLNTGVMSILHRDAINKIADSDKS